MEKGNTLATIKLMNQVSWFVWICLMEQILITWWQDKLKFILTVWKIFYVLDPNLEPIFEATDEDSEEVRTERKKE